MTDQPELGIHGAVCVTSITIFPTTVAASWASCAAAVWSSVKRARYYAAKTAAEHGIEVGQRLRARLGRQNVDENEVDAETARHHRIVRQNRLGFARRCIRRDRAVGLNILTLACRFAPKSTSTI